MGLIPAFFSRAGGLSQGAPCPFPNPLGSFHGHYFPIPRFFWLIENPHLLSVNILKLLIPARRTASITLIRKPTGTSRSDLIFNGSCPPPYLLL